MNKNILLDTDIVIDLLRKHETTVNILLTLQQQNYAFYTCPIIIAEVYAGAFAKEYPLVEQFFSFFHTLALDSEIGKIAGLYANQYRKAYNKISLEDYLIAACVKKYQLLSGCDISQMNLYCPT